MSRIEWTDKTWNPATGCDRVSEGCRGCYIERTVPFRLAGRRFDDRGHIDVELHSDRLDRPLRWRKPRMVFVNSLSDLFHPDIPDHFIAQVFAVMAQAKGHQFQVLTKRPQRMASFVTDECRCGGGHPTGVHLRSAMGWAGTPHSPIHVAGVDGDAVYHCRLWPLPNVWLGTSIELDKYAFRAGYVRATPAAVRWLSLEPLLGPLPSLDLTGIDWVVIGGESGPRARPMEVSWAEAIVEQCRAAGVARRS